MWILEQETSAPPPKKILDLPLVQQQCKPQYFHCLSFTTYETNVPILGSVINKPCSVTMHTLHFHHYFKCTI